MTLYAAFLVAALALCVNPGPDMMFIVAMGGRGGPTAGVMAAFGGLVGGARQLRRRRLADRRGPRPVR
ncbi:threonine/homoserine/homoserine lactone efflux protein [Streptomyces sp. DSM 40167]|nr:hypothetical protein [Streptomyces sp. DSM 40167]MDQ0405366.1 threonine/homoserine/homoserine lactone efflux protein [Streptomyces sp. DSM 40167]